MIGRAIGSLRIWKWVAVGAGTVAALGRLVYAVLCLIAADRVFPGLTAMRHGCAVPRSLALQSASYLGAFYRVATVSPIVSVLGIVAFATFIGWAWVAFGAGADLAPRGTQLASPFEIALMWMVPLIHLFMPFWYVRDLLHACDPKDLPPASFHTLPPSGYRTPGVETTDAWRRPWLPFHAWWALWVVSLATYPAALYAATATWSGPGELVFLRFEAARAAISIASLLLFVAVVRAATEILEERARRITATQRA